MRKSVFTKSLDLSKVTKRTLAKHIFKPHRHTKDMLVNALLKDFRWNPKTHTINAYAHNLTFELHGIRNIVFDVLGHGCKIFCGKDCEFFVQPDCIINEIDNDNQRFLL